MVDDVRESKPTISPFRHGRRSWRVHTSQVGLLAGGQYYLGRSFEIGECGILVGGEPDLKIDQKVVITFQVPGSQPAVVRGVVRNIEEKRKAYEVEFLNLDFSIKRAIRKFVASKTNKEPGHAA